jgi:hypothetical protein
MKSQESILDLVKCFRNSPFHYGICGIAAVRAAAILFVFGMIFAVVFPAGAAVRIEGLNLWLARSAERSMEAVYGAIPAGEMIDVKEELIRVVADRLLLGYSVESVSFGSDDEILIKLLVAEAVPEWTVSIIPPNLSPPVDEWFASDTAGMSDEILSMIRGVPIGALSWGDLDLRNAIADLRTEKLPGWRVALLARSALDGSVILDVSFIPEQPLTLAITSKINSSSIPAVLHSNLRDDLMKGFAPVIGVPVPWLDRHSDDLVLLGRQVLEDEYLVDVSKAELIVSAETGVVSNVNVELESRRYAGKLWMAVYAGAEDRYPEIGIHLGRRIQLLPRWDMELYGELILQLDDWALEKRIGMRWPLVRNIWIGGEWSDLDDIWWGRLEMESWARRPYIWLRYSEEKDLNAAIGYHINDHISIELHYDSRYEDEWNARALLNL